MTVNLIPQDELTLNLLAEVFAKMYLHSLNEKSDVPAQAVDPGSETPSANPRGQRQDCPTSDQELSQVEEDVSNKREH